MLARTLKTHLQATVLAIFALIHATFIVMTTYVFGVEEEFINVFRVFHRSLVLIQFVILYIVLYMYSKKHNITTFPTYLVPLSLAISANTLFTLHDVGSLSFVTSIAENLKVVPGQFITPHVVAYQQSSRIEWLDNHSDFFLIPLILYIMQLIMGLNHSYIHYIVTRFVEITLILAVIIIMLKITDKKMFNSLVNNDYKTPIVFLMVTTCLFITAYAYSSAFAIALYTLQLLFLHYMNRLSNRSQRYSHIIVLVLLVMTILLSSMRMTLTILVIALIAAAIAIMDENRGGGSIELSTFIVIIMLSLVRISISIHAMLYLEGYHRTFQTIVDTLYSKMLVEKKIELAEQPFVTITTYRSLIDKYLTLIGIFAYVLLTLFIAILSIKYILAPKDHSPLKYLGRATSSIYLVLLAINFVAYLSMKFGAPKLHIEELHYFMNPLMPFIVMLSVDNFLSILLKIRNQKTILIINLFMAIIAILAFQGLIRSDTKSLTELIVYKREYLLSSSNVYSFLVGFLKNPYGPIRCGVKQFFVSAYRFLLELKGVDVIEDYSICCHVDIVNLLYSDPMLALVSFKKDTLGIVSLRVCL